MRSLLLLLLFTLTVFAGSDLTRDVNKQHTEHKNLLKNPGFENGRSSWTPSTAAHLTLTTTDAEVGAGSTAASWDPVANNDTLKSETLAIPAGLYGRNCLFSFLYEGADTNIIAKITNGTDTINSESLSTQATHARQNLSFVCPSSGNLQVEFIADANGADTNIDSVYVGENYLAGTVAQAQIAGIAYIDGTASCIMTRTNTAYGLPTDTDCPGPTIDQQFIGDWQTTDVDGPSFTVNNLPPGRYFAQATFTGSHGSASATSGYILTDGTTLQGNARIGGTDATDNIPTTVAGVFEYTASGDRTFAVHCQASSGTCDILNDTDQAEVWFTLIKYPGSAEVAVTPEKNSWYVNAEIAGANPDLGAAGVAAAVEIIDGSLNMTKGSGSLAVEIPCSTTNASTGLTCSSGDESVGVVFTQPTAGPILVCATFTHRSDVNPSTTSRAYFRIVKTPNAAQTITTEGEPAIVSGQSLGAIGGAAIDDFPHRLCSLFNETASGQKTFRLFYEQAVAGSPGSGSVQADTMNDSVMLWEAYPIGNNLSLPLILNHVSTSNDAGVITNIAQIDCDGGSSITTNPGSWVSSVGNISGGACTVSFTSGVFANAPVCVATMIADPSKNLSVGSATVSSASVDCETTASAACTDHDFNLICNAAK